MSAAVLYLLNLRGGGGDLACDRHLLEAKRERAGDVVSVGRIDSPSEECPYCGIRQGEDHNGELRRAETKRPGASL